MLGKLGILVVAASALVLAASASGAKITAGDIFGAAESQETSTNVAGGHEGGFVSCDAGRRVITGGAYWHQTGTGGNYEEADNAYLGDSAVTKDGKGWYADGFHRYPLVSMDLTLYTLCIPKRQVKGTMLIGKTVSVNDSYDAHAKAKCPQGWEVYTGGAFFHAKGEAPNPDDGGGSRTSASMPLANGSGWYGAGTTGYGEKSKLTVRARCLPSRRIAPTKLVKETFTAGDNANTGGLVGCPGDRVPLTGGAYWRKANKGLARSVTAGVIGSSIISSLPGWYATGQSGGVDLRFTIVMRCL